VLQRLVAVFVSFVIKSNMADSVSPLNSVLTSLFPYSCSGCKLLFDKRRRGGEKERETSSLMLGDDENYEAVHYISRT